MVAIDRIKLAQNLLHHRELAGMTRYSLSKALGIGQTAYTRWEVGDCLPGLDSLVQLCVALCCSADDLLEGCILVDPPGPGGEGKVAA